MKVLLTNAEEGTLIVSKILEFEYFRDDKEIYIAGEVDDFTVAGVEEIDFNNYAMQLFKEGLADLSSYKTEVVE